MDVLKANKVPCAAPPIITYTMNSGMIPTNDKVKSVSVTPVTPPI